MSLPVHEALFHVHVRLGQRSAGRSAVAAAAYRAGEALHDRRIDRTFDYTKKTGVEEAFILAPAGAPDWAFDRAELWNRVETAERRRDAVLWREVEVSIPRDLPRESWRPLIESACKQYLTDGAVCDVAIHNPRAGDGGEQPHAHILLTLRALDPSTESGFAKRRNANLTARFESGGRQGGKRGEALKAERERWAEHMNRALREAGSNRRVDHRSYADRGIDREPEPLIGEERAARWRRTRRADRRLASVAATRALRRVTENQLTWEVEMAKRKTPFSEPKQEIKDRLLRERIPDLDLSATGLDRDAIYRVVARDNRPLRVQLRDDSWAEYDQRAGRVRYWGGPGRESQAALLATAIGDAEGVDDITYDPRSGLTSRHGRKRSRDGRPFPPRRLQEAEAEAIADRWRARGYTDVDPAPDGVWVHLSRSTRLQDTGDRLDVHGRADPDALRALALKAKEDWGGVMELYGSESFKQAAWLEAMRAGVEVVGYEPPEAVRRKWEREQARTREVQGARAVLSGAAAEAALLRRVAGGDAKAARDLPADLKAFVYGYAGGKPEALAKIASAQVGDIVPELDRWRYYGRAHLIPGGVAASLAAWADGQGEPPGCPHIAARLRQAIDGGRDRDAAVADALRALGVADENGQPRSSAELKAEIDARYAEARERQEEDEHAPGARHAHAHG